MSISVNSISFDTAEVAAAAVDNSSMNSSRSEIEDFAVDALSNLPSPVSEFRPPSADPSEHPRWEFAPLPEPLIEENPEEFLNIAADGAGTTPSMRLVPKSRAACIASRRFQGRRS